MQHQSLTHTHNNMCVCHVVCVSKTDVEMLCVCVSCCVCMCHVVCVSKIDVDMLCVCVSCCVCVCVMLCVCQRLMLISL